MKKIHFVESLNTIEVSTLVLCHEAIERELDRSLQGAIEYNLKQFSRPFSMTTNGAYPIPKLILVDSTLNVDLFTDEKCIACAVYKIPAEELAFYLMKKGIAAEAIFLLCDDAKKSEKRFEQYGHIFEGIRFAKEIISAPANRMTPEEVTKKCFSLQEQGLVVNCFDEEDLHALKAEALLAVGKGSSNAPRMVVLEWKGSQEKPIALVGKGICYDAGGINLKTSHLNEMKWDKAGAGVVVGIMDILSRLKVPLHVVGVIVLAENMPDGNAMKPGDVIDSLAGKSIEIIDTDCEGRLALADGIAYVQRTFSPKTLIDLGTLTLETFGALGGAYAGLFCNDTTLAAELMRAGESTGEKLWPLPLGPYYADQIRSKIADLKNSGVFRYGGSSAAAEFLRAFIDPKLPWAHLDISGTAWRLDRPEDGVTAFGVELLLKYLLDQAESIDSARQEEYNRGHFILRDGELYVANPN